MKVSVITISYNDLAGLQRTIPSVVGQTRFDVVEYIIIDGGSTDGSEAFIAQHRPYLSYYCSEKDGGIYEAMNKGLRHATGEYVVYTNSGDILYDSSVIEKFIAAAPTADVCIGDTIITYKSGQEKLWKSQEDVSMRVLYDGSVSHQAAFVRTEVLRKHGFDERYRIVSDWKLFIQLFVFDNCSYQKLNFVVSRFMWGGISSCHEKAQTERKRVLDEYFPPRLQEDLAYLHHGYTEVEKQLKKINLHKRSGRFLSWIIGLIYKYQHGNR
ncbi:glycosyltransferase family 2 protein [Phocaeicola massiliensis]|uniref:glycosyltransferase family 2 protein n=1 Tax=Phocaeicola massiliensis TaxID=204516 RepID=UPI00202E1684|nr:glycosyltransferase family 2 protein [Phocaeicola massiliensis]MCM1613862.1 glycosyltransferase [Phocaeicola massiliensis]MCM1705849.1 glycosyltransferase [Phocaeicola massiliensis]